VTRRSIATFSPSSAAMSSIAVPMASDRADGRSNRHLP
jgi:hypothetical protein